MTTNCEERFFDAVDGIRLFLRYWPVDDAKGLLAVVHGFAEHSGRYRQLAGDLCAAGWAVAAFDYRGHGQSGGRRAHVDGFGQYVQDLRSFLEEIGKSGEGSKPVLLGHSLGGLISARYSQLMGDTISGLVLSSPFLKMAFEVPRIKAVAGKMLSGLLPTISLKTGLDPAVLSHNSQVVESYRDDPLVSDVASARWFTEVLEAQRVASREVAKINMPMLVMQAGDDLLTSAASTRAFFDEASMPDKTFRLYEGYYHEIFNEVGRDKVVEDLINWLKTHNA